MPSPIGSPSRSPLTLPQKVTKKKTEKHKKPDLKGKKKIAPAEPGNEGIDQSNWDYTPPEGAVLLDFKEEDAGQFDWDAVNGDENVEIWLIRIPEAVKPKQLENLMVDMPSTSHTSCIGTLKRKYMSYDLWDLGDDNGTNLVGGDEIKGISCLLPRKKKKGKLYLAPKPIARHLVLAAQHVKPTVVKTSSEAFKNPQRPSYPKELLKHRFMPHGSLVKPTTDETSPNDAPTNKAVHRLGPPSMSNKETINEISPEILEKKSKKRKAPDVEIVDTTTPKKSKKTKVVL